MLPVVFLCADLTALVSFSLWFSVLTFVEGELQSALNSMFYASGTCTHGKTEQLSTRPIISYRMLKMAFSVSLLKYTFDVKRKLLSFSKNGMFQHLWSQAVRSVWEFENGLRHFTAWRKWEISFISIFKSQIQTHHTRTQIKMHFWHHRRCGIWKYYQYLRSAYFECSHAWGGPSQVLNQMLDKVPNQMLDKDIIFSLQAYYCCFAHIVLYSHHVSLTHLLFAAKKKKKTVKDL